MYSKLLVIIRDQINGAPQAAQFTWAADNYLLEISSLMVYFCTWLTIYYISFNFLNNYII